MPASLWTASPTSMAARTSTPAIRIPSRSSGRASSSEPDPARSGLLQLAAKRRRERPRDICERLLDPLRIDVLRHFHVLVVRIGLDPEPNDLRQTEHVEAIDEQRVGDAEEQLFDDGVQGGHRSHRSYHILATPGRPANLPSGRIS